RGWASDDNPTPILIPPRSPCYALPRSGGRDALLRGRPLPPEPVDDGAAHHPLEIAALQPVHFLGEHGHALPPGDRHAGDVGAPEAAVGAERVDDLFQI